MEVHLTVSWKEGKLTENIDLVTHVVSLGPGSDRNGAAAGTTGAPGAAAVGFVRADNGMPVPNAVPGADGSMRDPSDNTLVIPADQFGTPRPGPGGLPPGAARGFDARGLGFPPVPGKLGPRPGGFPQ